MSSSETVISKLVLSQIDESARGPTQFSHWVIPNSLLASAYPADKNPVIQMKMTKDIMKTGVQVIVNLMEEKELTTFTPYKEIMNEHAKLLNRDMEFISFPIRDGYVHADDEKVLNFCLELCDRIKRDQIILIHCWGGHGRTGTIVSIIIGILFDLNGDEAMLMNSRLHDLRIRTNGTSSPETESQRNQIRRILDEMYRKK